MKKNQFFAIALPLVLALFFCAGNLSAQWKDGGWAVWPINLNANVGIGTSNPNNARLQFNNTLGNKITLWGGGPYNYGFGINGANLVAYIPGGGGDRFSIRADSYNGAEQFMVTSDGRVGIGGAYPDYGKMQFDNNLGNKITLWGDGTNNYGFGIDGGNLVAYIPNLDNHRFSLRLNGYDGSEVFSVARDGKISAGSRVCVGATGTESNGFSLLQFKNTTSATGGVIRSSLGSSDAGDAPLILEAGSLHYSSGDVIRMTMNGEGNMGIGTGTLTHKLNVNGAIRAKEVRVESGWADFVFEPDYTLRPLSEVEDYIRENKHLPDVASAADIQKEGLQVGEQMTQMMRKIEELTLYVIDLKKENLKTQEENADLKKRLEKLEK